jgi:hypothetical protein
MYELVRQRHAVRRRTLQLTILDAAVSACVFTFG